MMKSNFFNPPPNGLQPAEVGNAVSPTVVIDKITLKNKDADVEKGEKNQKEKTNSAKDVVVSVTPSIQQGIMKRPVKPWYNNKNKCDQLRMRVILCTNPNYAQDVMDYMSQRYNEYQSGQMATRNAKGVASFLDGLAKSTDSQTIESAYPEGPLDTDFLTKKIKNNQKDVFVYQVPGMEGVYVYDESCTKLLKKDEKGKTILTNQQEKVFAGTQGGNVQEYRNLQIPVKTIDFNIGALRKSADLEHLSCYAFTYNDPDVFLEQNNLRRPQGKIITTPLESGMGYITSKTMIGSKKTYTSQPKRPEIVGKENFVTLEAPDSGMFSDIRGIDYLKRMEVFDSLTETFYDSMVMKNVGNKNFNNISPEMASSINYKNYFSNLWLSRDKGENIRYMFSFDKQAFLRENSMYSQMYLNDQVAQILMNGGGVLRREEASKIIDIKLVRRRVHRDKVVSSNKLGSMTKRKPYENTEITQEKIIGSPTIENISVGNQGVDFYSGVDFYNEEIKRQSSAIYQYGVTFYMQDSAPVYLMMLSEQLQSDITSLGELCDFIINHGGSSKSNLSANIGSGVLYDTKTGTRQQLLQNIEISSGNAYNIVERAVRFYINTMSIFAQLTSEKDKVISDLIKFANEPEMNNLFKLIDIIAEFRKKIEQIIEVQFPNGYHDDRFAENDMLKRKGFCQRKYNILQITHYFNELHDVRETYKTGYCFISPEFGAESRLGSLTVDGLRSRAVSEFSKYFSPSPTSETSTPLDLAILDDQFKQGSHTYFSPETIYIHGRQTINQSLYTTPGEQNQTDYDLDTYARLLMDLITLKNQKNNILQITDQGDGLSENTKLFENLTYGLSSKDCSISSEDVSVSDFFSVPKPIQKSEFATAKKEKPKKLKKTSTISVLPFVIGGLKDSSPGTEDFFNTQKNSILNKGFEDELNKDPSEKNQGLEEAPQPIKLAFSILGQMEFSVSGIKEDAERLSLSKQNIKQSLENSLLMAPNQIKSMLIVATDMESGVYGGGLDAVRNVTLDLERSHPQQEISTVVPGENYPPYQPSLDPMLVYSKLTAFWMNYKNLCVVEYLSGFDKGKTNPFIRNYINSVSPKNETFSSIRKKEIWKKVTPDSLLELAGNNLLCRVRMIDENDNIATSQDSAPSRKIDFSHRDLFNLPLYDQYFILKA